MEQMIMLSTMNVLLFFLASHPLFLVMILISQTIVTVMFLNWSSETSWMNYIIFLIFLGALLIIFIYLSALTPNEMVFSNMPMISMMTMIAILMTTNFTFLFMNKNMNNNDAIMNINVFMLNSLIFWAIMYLIVALGVCMYFISYMKSPLKQEIS